MHVNSQIILIKIEMSMELFTAIYHNSFISLPHRYLLPVIIMLEMIGIGCNNIGF